MRLERRRTGCSSWERTARAARCRARSSPWRTPSGTWCGNGSGTRLLTKMIEAMGLRREDVYICNTVKCRPPNNRNPEPEELLACEPFLKGQLGAVKPEAIVTLGKFAAQALLREQTPITRLRGQWREYEGIPVMPTFHPAYLLRSPAEKGKVWEALKQVMKKLDLPLPKGGAS